MPARLTRWRDILCLRISANFSSFWRDFYDSILPLNISADLILTMTQCIRLSTGPRQAISCSVISMAWYSLTLLKGASIYICALRESSVDGLNFAKTPGIAVNRGFMQVSRWIAGGAAAGGG
jgi:hypothetical protein